MTTTAEPKAPITRKPGEATPRAVRVKRARLLRRIALGVIAVLVVAAFAYAWRPKPVPVETAAAARGDLVVIVEEMARTRVRDRYSVASPIAANALRIELRPGDLVEEGAVLARLVPFQPTLLDPRSRAEAQARAAAAAAAERQARAGIARAELASRHATDELERTRKLTASGTLAPDTLLDAELAARLRVEELASARFAAQSAAHEAAMATAALKRFDPGDPSAERFDVTSPVKGRVLRVVNESARPVQPGAPLIEVGDPGALEIVADVLTADAVKMRPGARVTVERWGGASLKAHVRTVEPSAFTRISALGVEEQRVAVISDFDEPRERWAALGDGYRVEVRIVVAERKDVVRVPLGSVFRRGEGWAAFVVQDGRARLRPVRLGQRSDTHVEVEEGVAPGDAVVVHPSERVAENARVTTEH